VQRRKGTGLSKQRHLGLPSCSYRRGHCFDRIPGVWRDDYRRGKQVFAHRLLPAARQTVTADERHLQPAIALWPIRQFLKGLAGAKGHGIVLGGDDPDPNFLGNAQLQP